MRDMAGEVQRDLIVVAALRIKEHRERAAQAESELESLITSPTAHKDLLWVERVRRLLTQRPKQELVCESCQCDYTVWYADNQLWNAVVRDRYHFLCLTCFAMLCEIEEVYKPTSWKLVPVFRDVDHGVPSGITVEESQARCEVVPGCGLLAPHAGPCLAPIYDLPTPPEKTPPAAPEKASSTKRKTQDSVKVPESAGEGTPQVSATRRACSCGNVVLGRSTSLRCERCGKPWGEPPDSDFKTPPRPSKHVPKPSEEEIRNLLRITEKQSLPPGWSFRQCRRTGCRQPFAFPEGTGLRPAHCVQHIGESGMWYRAKGVIAALSGRRHPVDAK